MHRHRRTKPPLICYIILALVTGCSDSTGRRSISGVVLVDQQPLKNGIIDYRPAAGHTGPTSGAMIENGAFSIPAEKGLMPGEYVVTVQAFKKTGRTIQDYQRGPIPEQIPIQFKEAGTLKSTVKSEGGNTFEYRLTSTN
jgi:hypothetical protein